MSLSEQGITRELYHILDTLPRYNHLIPAASLPENGIYLFYESGETVELDGRIINRIVRVGTHNKDGRFRTRIRQHYGNRSSLKGNKNASVFRKHVGGAIIRRMNPADPRMPEWLKSMGKSDPRVEEAVSTELRSWFTFVCFRVDDAGERLSLEEGLISLIANAPLGSQSGGWLGNYSASEIIRRTGLWNTQKVEGVPLTRKQLERIHELCENTYLPSNIAL